MSEFKKNQFDSLNETMKKAYRKIKEIDMDDLSVIRSVEYNKNNIDEHGYTQDLHLKNNDNLIYSDVAIGLDTDKKKVNTKLNYHTKRLIDSIDNMNAMFNKDFKELDDVINTLEKDLKSI
jgi:hypothetical protein